MAFKPAAVRWALLAAAFLPLADAVRADDFHSQHNCDVWLRHCDTERARQFLFQTEDALRQAQADVDAAASSRDAAATDERRLAQSLAGANSEIDRLQIELGRAETDLKRLRDDARQSAATAEQCGRDVDDLKPQLEASQKALDSAIDEAVAAFESGDPVQSAVARLNEAEVTLNRVESACVQTLSQTEAFGKAQAEVQKLEAERDARRAQTPRDEDALATASKAWIDAKRHVKDLVDAAKDADPAVVAAKRDKNGIRDEIATLRKEFERGLPQLTPVAEAQKAFDAVHDRYGVAAASAEVSDAKSRRAQQSLDERTADADNVQKDLSKVKLDADRIEGDLDLIHTASVDADDQVSQAIAHLDRVRDDRESAVIALRHAEGIEQLAWCPVIVREPIFGGGHDRDRDHDRDWRRDHDRDRNDGRDANGDRDGDRGRDGNRIDNGRDDARRPRVDGEPVGRPRRAGGAEFVDGSNASTQPANAGPIGTSPATRTPQTAGSVFGDIRPPTLDMRIPNNAVERQRLIAQRAAERERSSQQRRQQMPAAANVMEPSKIVVPVVVPKAAEREREPQGRNPQRESAEKRASAMTALGAREAAAERERQAQAKDESVIAERQQQREQARAADAVKDQARRAERESQQTVVRQREAQKDAQQQMERESRQAADRQREAQRAADRQNESAARETRRQDVVQQRQDKREAAKQGDDSGQARARR